jgi:hypothetical protein
LTRRSRAARRFGSAISSRAFDGKRRADKKMGGRTKARKNKTRDPLPVSRDSMEKD